MFNLITLDGYFEGMNKWDIAWHSVDDEFNQFSIEQLDTASGLIFGRVTYEGMASYWPTPAAINDDPTVAAKMNSIPKYVFSRTLEKADWSNTQLIKGDAVDELRKLKQRSNKDLFIFGSANLSATFTNHRLIDEYRLMVNPVILGTGGALFQVNGKDLKFNLLNTKVFKNG
ncbi:MAG: dihydrofolate reductase, partial [Anaerolineae bacterium]|nr:dihydrofolate reductase [Anaerolineae bacterium]